jgi:hypothetical protein
MTIPPPTLIPLPLVWRISSGDQPIVVPMTDSNDLQPSQKSLEDINEIENTLQELGRWLQRAKFEPGKTERTEICAEKMPGAAKQLLEVLGFKVH